MAEKLRQLNCFFFITTWLVHLNCLHLYRQLQLGTYNIFLLSQFLVKTPNDFPTLISQSQTFTRGMVTIPTVKRFYFNISYFWYVQWLVINCPVQRTGRTWGTCLRWRHHLQWHLSLCFQSCSIETSIKSINHSIHQSISQSSIDSQSVSQSVSPSVSQSVCVCL